MNKLLQRRAAIEGPGLCVTLLSHIESAFFVLKVRRSEIAGKKIFEIGEKYYFEDLGSRHTIIGYWQDTGKSCFHSPLDIHLSKQPVKFGYYESNFIIAAWNDI